MLGWLPRAVGRTRSRWGCWPRRYRAMSSMMWYWRRARAAVILGNLIGTTRQRSKPHCDTDNARRVHQSVSWHNAPWSVGRARRAAGPRAAQDRGSVCGAAFAAVQPGLVIGFGRSAYWNIPSRRSASPLWCLAWLRHGCLAGVKDDSIAQVHATPASPASLIPHVDGQW